MTFTTDEAIPMMWSYADKHERMRCFHKIVTELGAQDPVRFWDQFWSIWRTSENLFNDEDYVSELVAIGLELGSSLLGMEEEDLAAYEALPEQITIYRGSTGLNHFGWSWTTDLEKARWFAERSYGTTDRYVYETKVGKNLVLAYLGGRNESEIVVDPADLDFDAIETLEVFEKPNSETGGLFYAIQTGQMVFNNPEMDKARAQMMVATMTGPYEARIADVAKACEFTEWAGINGSAYYRYLGEEMTKKANGEETLDLKTAGSEFRM